jgi:hypothetical protein
MTTLSKTVPVDTATFPISIRVLCHVSTDYPVETYDLRQPDAVNPVVNTWFPYYRLTSEFINSHLFDNEAFTEFFKKYKNALLERHQLIGGTVRTLLKQGVDTTDGDRSTKAHNAFHRVDPHLVEQLVDRFLYWMSHYSKGVYPSPKTLAVKTLTQLSNSPELNISIQATALQEDDPMMSVQAVQAPMIPVGFVTTDCNILREFQYFFNGVNILPRFVMIYFCLRKNKFHVVWHQWRDIFMTSSLDNTKSIYVDNHTQEELLGGPLKNRQEFKKINIHSSVPVPADEATRVFNQGLFGKIRKFSFSLQSFIKRYQMRIPLNVKDENMSQFTSSASILPVNYTIVVYSIVRTWLSQHSESFKQRVGIDYSLGEEQPYLLCKQVNSMGDMLTNTFLLGKSE